MAYYAALSGPDVPTKDECTMAFLAHLLQVFTGFIAPLVIFCIKEDSRFVRFHALQALIWQICYSVVFFGAMFIFFITMFASVARGNPGGHHQAPPRELFVFFPLIWLLGIGGWVLNLVLGIMYGVKSNRGEWAGYPIIGPWLLPKYRTTVSSGAPVSGTF